MAYETIRLETDARGVATLTLDRPDKHNAMNARMIAELTEAAHELAAETWVRIVVLTGAGESFCAGGDLAWMKAQMEADRLTRTDEARRLADMLRAFDRLPKPVIAKVNGQAYGGGVGLLSVTDTAVAADHARFGLTEVRLGLIPATISPYVAAKLGRARSREVFFSGARFDAGEAVRIGLVRRAVAAEGLDEAVEAEIRPYLDAAPGAVGAAKALLERLTDPIDEGVIAMSAAALADQWETEEAAEGIAAFLERRSPSWRRER